MGAYITINPTPSGDITGSGTAGYLAMFTSANVIGDSTINQSSGNTGVGMAASANAGFAITTTAATSGTKTGFYFLQTGNTGQAASTEANGVLWSMGTRQWATGAITDQREFYIGSCAYSFVAASTITNAYGLYVEAATAGTNATITNNWAAGFSGNIEVAGNIDVTGGNRLISSTGGGLRLGAASGNTVRLDISGTASLTASSTQITLRDPMDFVLGTTTGTKFGTATSQKLSFWNATPIVQPTTAVTAATFVANAGTAVNDASTFDGYTIGQVVKALRNTGLLQ